MPARRVHPPRVPRVASGDERNAREPDVDLERARLVQVFIEQVNLRERLGQDPDRSGRTVDPVEPADVVESGHRRERIDGAPRAREARNERDLVDQPAGRHVVEAAARHVRVAVRPDLDVEDLIDVRTVGRRVQRPVGPPEVHERQSLRVDLEDPIVDVNAVAVEVGQEQVAVREHADAADLRGRIRRRHERHVQRLQHVAGQVDASELAGHAPRDPNPAANRVVVDAPTGNRRRVRGELVARVSEYGGSRQNREDGRRTQNRIATHDVPLSRQLACRSRRDRTGPETPTPRCLSEWAATAALRVESVLVRRLATRDHDRVSGAIRRRGATRPGGVPGRKALSNRLLQSTSRRERSPLGGCSKPGESRCELVAARPNRRRYGPRL